MTYGFNQDNKFLQNGLMDMPVSGNAATAFLPQNTGGVPSSSVAQNGFLPPDPSNMGGVSSVGGGGIPSPFTVSDGGSNSAATSGGYGQQYAGPTNTSDGVGGNSGAAFGGYGSNASGGDTSEGAFGGTMSFDDGGMIPSQGGAGNGDTGTGSLDNAVQSVMQTLQQGRARNGLPPTLMSGEDAAAGYADGGDVTEGGDMSDPSAGGIPEQPAQSGGMAGQTAAKMVGYLKGADAVPPEIARALQRRIDPQGQMDPNARNLMAVAQAPDQAKWGLMQHMRQKYDATKAFAGAAAQGTQGKPPDINASTRAATQAFQNLPDGNAVQFQPHPQGVAVHIKSLVGGRKGYDEGGDVTATDDGISASDNSALKSLVLSTPDYVKYITGSGSQYDNVMDKGMEQSLSPSQSGGGQTEPLVDALTRATGQQYTTGNNQLPPGAAQAMQQPAKYAGITPNAPYGGAGGGGGQQRERPFADQNALPEDLRRQANALFPRVDQEEQRTAFIEKNMTARAEQQSKLEVAKNTRLYGSQATGDARTNAAQIAGDARTNAAQIAGDARTNATQIAADSREQVARTKSQADIFAAQAKSPMDVQKYKTLSSYLTANPGATPQAIRQQMAILGINPQAFTQQQPQAPAQQAPAQQGGGPEAYLRSHPETRDQYDAKFGPGAAAKVLGQQ